MALKMLGNAGRRRGREGSPSRCYDRFNHGKSIIYRLGISSAISYEIDNEIYEKKCYGYQARKGNSH